MSPALPRRFALLTVSAVLLGGVVFARAAELASPAVMAAHIQGHFNGVSSFLNTPTGDFARRLDAPGLALALEQRVSAATGPEDAVAGLAILKALSEPQALAALESYLRRDPAEGRATAAELHYLSTGFDAAGRAAFSATASNLQRRLNDKLDAAALSSVFDGARAGPVPPSDNLSGESKGTGNGLKLFDREAGLKDVPTEVGVRYLEKLRVHDFNGLVTLLEGVAGKGRAGAPWAWEKYGAWIEPVARLKKFSEKYPELNAEFGHDVGVDEGWTLKQHTLMVLWQFERHVARQLPSDKERELFRTMLILHDLGKPAAVRAGNKQRQHEFTLPLVRKYLTAEGFPQSDIALIEALVDFDPIGRLLWIRPAYKKHARDPVFDEKVALAAALDMLAKMEKTSGVSRGRLLALSDAFYKSDASAYTRPAGGVESLDANFEYGLEGLRFSPKAQSRLAPLFAAVN